MSMRLLKRLRSELELIERFATTYASKFEQLIDRLNATPEHTDQQCVRLCIEAVNMMMVSQTQMARAIRQIVEEPEPTLRAA